MLQLFYIPMRNNFYPNNAQETKNKHYFIKVKISFDYLQYWCKEDRHSSEDKHQCACKSLFPVLNTNLMILTTTVHDKILVLNSTKKVSFDLPHTKKLWLLTRSTGLAFHLQRVDVGDGNDRGRYVPGQTHEGANGHEDAHPEQVQMITTAFLLQ